VSRRAGLEVAENLGPTGIRYPDQLVASRYTEYTIPANRGNEKVNIKFSLNTSSRRVGSGRITLIIFDLDTKWKL